MSNKEEIIIDCKHENITINISCVSEMRYRRDKNGEYIKQCSWGYSIRDKDYDTAFVWCKNCDSEIEFADICERLT